MSINAEEALKFSKYRATMSNQISTLKNKKISQLHIFYDGGAFTVSRELITFVTSISMTKKAKTLVLLDDNDTPIRVNVEEFLEELLDVYFQTMNSYFTEYQKLRKARDVESILDV